MTDASSDIEERRLALQGFLDRTKSQKERNQLGQFATPTALACDLVAYGLELLPEGTAVRFLDPAIGTGSFYAALLATAPTSHIESAEGYEVDPHYAAPARTLWAEAPLTLHLADFTTAPPPSTDEQRFNLLICNPPYVRHHHLKNGEKIRLQDFSETVFGVRIDGLAGLYCYFLALSHFWMRAGGIAGWLIPSEFMDVNYGRAVKRYLLDKVTLLRIHRFDPNDVQFADALVSSAVVFFRNELPPANHSVEFTFGGTLHAPAIAKHISAGELRREPKWTRFPIAAARPAATGPILGDFFQIKRGLATGDNSFFILTPKQIEAHRLPRQFFRPILPSPRYLEGEEVQADAAGNPMIERKLFLLDCRLAEEEIRENYPELWRYLQTGKPDIAGRYLCKSRKLWYAQEDRPPTSLICTYMGRSGTKRGKPFRFILNHSKATAANVYLLLYPKPALARVLKGDPSLTRKIWELLNNIRLENMLEEGRVYGGGLHKMEPNELANVRADSIQALLATSIMEPMKQLAFFEDLV